MEPRRVVVTGLGVVGPCGIGRDAFWQGLLGPAPSERFHTPTSASYLAWRYSAPGLTYSVSDAEEALVVFRLRRRGRLRELRICDMFARDLSAKGVLGLRRCIASAVARHEPDYVVAALRPEVAELLRTID